jgi:hypothetical protein
MRSAATKRVVVRHDRVELRDQTFEAHLLGFEVRECDLHLLCALFQLREKRFVHPVSLSPVRERSSHA